ncbi:MAG TPA: O-antigen ligase family protein, partial [Myxococcaceae bacterium]|nr:O-antigen ligase family protein [Myxococcaceae bacterium]
MPSVSASRSRTSRYSLGAEVALAVLMVLCPLALGGAAGWLLWPLVLLAGGAFVLACVGARRQGQSLHLPLMVLPLGAGAALCLLQLVPLPAGLLSALSPEAAALRDFILVPLGLEGPRPLSLEPTATWRELGKHLAYLLAFVAAVQVSRSRQARHRLLATLAATGAGLAVLGLLHELLGVDELLGLVAFAHARPPLVTPFGNPNHLAAFLGLSSTVALGLALSRGTLAQAAPYARAAVLGGTGVLLSLSRGGIAFFVFGQLALALLLLRRRRAGQGGGQGVAVLLGLLAVLAVGGYAASERLRVELGSLAGVESLRRGKMEPWPMMLEAARAFPLGMGRGAFASAFPRYQTEPNPNTFTHPENAVLQLAAEFGVPGLLLLLAVLWGFGRLLRREGLGTVELAVLAGVAALGLHELFDFSLELPASAVAALVVLATVARPEERAQSRTPRGFAPRPVLVGGMGLTALALLALVPGGHTLEEAEVELAALISSRAPLDEVRARGLALIDRHPADYALQDLLGTACAAEGAAAEALAFANRALYLRPLDARAHRVAARALLSLGRRTQAFLEYRLAFEAGEQAVLKDEALGLARTLEELRALTPDSPAMVAQLVSELARRPGAQELALAWLGEARERLDASPEAVVLWELEARLRLSRREFAEAEAASEEVSRREPEALASHLLRADVLRARGRQEEALRALEALRARFPGEVELSFSLARQQLEAGLTQRARETLQQVSPFLSSLEQRARLFQLEGASFEQEGYLARALESWRTASRIHAGPDVWFK